MQPRTRRATRLPMACSGRTTWETPTCARISACEVVIALAQTAVTPSLRSTNAVSTLASTLFPMPITALAKSPTPSCSIAWMSVESAWTTWVQRPARSWTRLGSLSMASTWTPSRSSSSARDLPNRPRPMTTTPPDSAIFLANEGCSFRVAVAAVPLPQGEGRHQSDRAEAAEEHQRYEDKLPGFPDLGGDARREPDRGERRGRLEQHVPEGQVGELGEDHRPPDDCGHAKQGHRGGLPHDAVVDSPVKGDDVLLAADLSDDDEEQDNERRHLQATSRSRRPP